MNALTPDPVDVSAPGVVASGCRKCEALKFALSEAFSRHGITLSFSAYVWDMEPWAAIRFSSLHGIDDIPAFVICGKVFKDGFRESDVREAAAVVGR